MSSGTTEKGSNEENSNKVGNYYAYYNTGSSPNPHSSSSPQRLHPPVETAAYGKNPDVNSKYPFYSNNTNPPNQGANTQNPQFSNNPNPSKPGANTQNPQFSNNTNPPNQGANIQNPQYPAQGTAARNPQYYYGYNPPYGSTPAENQYYQQYPQNANFYGMPKRVPPAAIQKLGVCYSPEVYPQSQPYGKDTTNVQFTPESYQDYCNQYYAQYYAQYYNDLAEANNKEEDFDGEYIQQAYGNEVEIATLEYSSTSTAQDGANESKEEGSTKKKSHVSFRESFERLYGNLPLCKACTETLQKHFSHTGTIEEFRKFLSSKQSRDDESGASLHATSSEPSKLESGATDKPSEEYTGPDYQEGAEQIRDPEINLSDTDSAIYEGHTSRRQRMSETSLVEDKCSRCGGWTLMRPESNEVLYTSAA